MLITFSTPLANPCDVIRDAAIDAGCYASITWSRSPQVRFILTTEAFGNSPASSDKHDAVIKTILTLDPDATVRTARAVYEGLQDFKTQMKARVP